LAVSCTSAVSCTAVGSFGDPRSGRPPVTPVAERHR
jgi:hypothetical protein